MRHLWFCAVLLAAWPAVGTVAPNPAAERHSRREAVARALADGVTVLFGRTEAETGDSRSSFYQEPNFYYLAGRGEPGGVVLIEPGKNGLGREILFLAEHDEAREKWTGRRAAPSDPDVRDVTGFEQVMPLSRLDSELRASLERVQNVYTVGTPATSKLQALVPLREVGSAALAIARLRMKKSAYELDLIGRSLDATMAAHRAAWKRAGAGAYEYQVAAAMTAVYFDRGCERSSYPPIVGSGPNSVFLHYEQNSRRMEAGEVLLMDVGSECAGYAADLTRTVPVSGKFSPRQREIYEIVLGAEKAAIAAVKPGVLYNKNQPGTVYRVAYDYINTHGHDLHGEPLGKYFIHGISHSIGLEVHDASDPSLPLEEGMVISVEPGIYLPEERIGIRIEDMVLVTRDGAKLLSADLPREADEIEKAMAR